jgi:hypothetical protein
MHHSSRRRGSVPTSTLAEVMRDFADAYSAFGTIRPEVLAAAR